ncbi:MAG TPA: hypothetical protein DCS54_06220 [Oribacterium sp.]|nr:hypothetical protein [Oribacterium sp.]
MPTFRSATSQRSMASRTEGDTFPTITERGKPLLSSTSTDTMNPSTPDIPALLIFDSIFILFGDE